MPNDRRRNAPLGKIINLENYDQCQLVQSLQAIVATFSGCKSSKRRFIKEFPGFIEIRLPNIVLMAELADGLDTHHQNCNIATIVGASVGLLSGLVAVTGACVLTFATGGVAAPLLAAAPAIAIGGGTTSVLGGLTSFGTLVTERIIENLELEKIKELLKKDKEYFERVFPFIQQTAAFQEAVEQIMDFNVFLDMMAAFSNDPDTADAIRREQPMRELPLAVKNFIDDLNITQEEKMRAKELLLDILSSGISVFRKILDLFVKIVPFIKKTYQILDMAMRCFRVADASFDVGNAVANLVRTAKPAAKLAAAFGILSAIGVAIDLVVIISTSKDMAKGSKSKLANKTRQCATQMQNELNALEQIYVELTDEVCEFF